MSRHPASSPQPAIAFGPELPGVGSWEWVGVDTMRVLSRDFQVLKFSGSDIPDCDLLVIVKYPPAGEIVKRAARSCNVIYCPVDYYGSSAEIDRDGTLLASYQRILLHQPLLRKYFQSYAPVECVEHHVRFVPSSIPALRASEEVLWVGMKSHLPILQKWLKRHPLRWPLRILTNLDPQDSVLPSDFGLSGAAPEIRIEKWNQERHLELVETVGFAIDIKGNDFRQRHKPPVKAIDYIASGLPLAMNGDSATVRQLSEFGFEIASPLDYDRWGSEAYHRETCEMGRRLRETHSLDNVAAQWKSIILSVLSENRLSATFDGSFWQEENQEIKESTIVPEEPVSEEAAPTKIAVVSLLFNWPSTGGGNIHTWELVKFLGKAGFDVRHFFARFAEWGIGELNEKLAQNHTPLEFNQEQWTVSGISETFRQAVDHFEPDYVLITDCWNFKPHLARALKDYPYYLRMQSSECLCPLNNLQMLANDEGELIRCRYHQLATPDQCRRCLETRGSSSGILHQVERALSQVEHPEYQAILHQTLQNAEAVLTLNPLTAEQYRPYAQRVEVVTWGMDADRFSSFGPEVFASSNGDAPVRIIFAGLVDEWIKGFHIVQEACRRLWLERQDFELWATSDSGASNDPFIKYLGWKSQSELIAIYRESDICVVPTIVPDGLSRTSVEAMGVGLPVVASNIGGLPYTVADGVTGLLCRPGDVADWSQALSTLISDPGLRRSMGRAGRKQFEDRFTWEKVIDGGYRPLLSPRALPDGRCVQV